MHTLKLSFIFLDKVPVCPYKTPFEVKRTKQIRHNNLDDTQPKPFGIDYSRIITSDIPIVA